MKPTIHVLPLFLLLAACASSAPTSKSDDPAATPTGPDIRGEVVEYAVGEVQLKGFLAYDAAQKGKRPGVLVVHEWWGHDDYARTRAKQLAGMGYTALALDMYGDGKQAKHPGDAKKFMMEVTSNMPTGVARFRAAQNLLESHDTTEPDKTAAIGYCFGGAIVLHMARSGAALRGVASFHGNLATQTPAQSGQVKAAVLVAHGAADPFVPAENIDTFKTEMQNAGVDLTFVAYEGAKHSFTNPAATARGKEFELPLEYDEKADKASWAELDKFLKKVFAE